MKIDTHRPPQTYTMHFTHDEGVTLVMALRDATETYKAAVRRDEWRKWADDLEAALRS